jgi:hypothetical protein
MSKPGKEAIAAIKEAVAEAKRGKTAEEVSILLESIQSILDAALDTDDKLKREGLLYAAFRLVGLELEASDAGQV